MRRLGIAVLFLIATAAPVQAAIFCEPRRTADGFVALRSGPGVQYRRLLAVRPGRTVLLIDSPKKGWQHVAYWPVQWRRSGRGPGPEGWMRRALLRDCG